MLASGRSSLMVHGDSRLYSIVSNRGGRETIDVGIGNTPTASNGPYFTLRQGVVLTNLAYSEISAGVYMIDSADSPAKMDTFVAYQRAEVRRSFHDCHSQYLFLSAQGWDGDLYFDGPSFGVKEGLFFYLPTGVAAKQVDFRICNGREAIRESEPKDWVRGITRGLRTKVLAGKNGGIEVSCQTFDLFDAVFLVLMRRSYWGDILSLSGLPEGKRQKSIWSRLCQNIGVFCGKMRPPDGVSLGEVSASMGSSLFSPHSVQAIARFLNRSSHVIPKELFFPPSVQN